MVHQPKFKIGQQFRPVGKQARICTIEDIHRTYNSKNELVKVRYVVSHTFMGQTIMDYDCVETTIARAQLF